ncbi:MAG: hypothetical protein L3K23_00790 [Thermoplasmata archaeon]|nr:hypothetical protein [Thermoplasmata archaeon]
MPDPASTYEQRLRALELQIEQLKDRLEALERLSGPRAENPTDTAVVRKKVTYDWQR